MAKEKIVKLPAEGKHPRTLLRFVNLEHHQMIKKCAEISGLSMNSWLIQATLKTARRELAEAGISAA